MKRTLLRVEKCSVVRARTAAVRLHYGFMRDGVLSYPAFQLFDQVNQ